MKRAVRTVLDSPLGAPIRNYYRGLGTILLYHRITEERFDLEEFNPELGLKVNIDDFDAQMQYVSKAFTCLSLESLVDVLTGSQPAPEKHFVAVTFDDGFADNLHLALPVLEKYNVPATIFVTSGFIDRTHEPWWMQTGASISGADSISFEWQGRAYNLDCSSRDQKYQSLFLLDRLMKACTLQEQHMLVAAVFESTGASYSFGDQFLSWEETAFLDSHPLVTIGAHTVSHAPLASCSPENLDYELSQSRDRLSQQLGRQVTLNAYPYGLKEECSLREFRAAEKAGYRASFTSRCGHIFGRHRSALHAIPRIAVDHFMTLDVVQRFVLGGLSAIARRRSQPYVTD